VRRFYFHVRIGGRLMRDPEGVELLDLDIAHSEALAAGQELMEEARDKGVSLERQQFEIADASGATKLIVPFGLAVGRERAF